METIASVHLRSELIGQQQGAATFFRNPDQAVATAREAGASGASAFEMDGLTDAHLAALRDAVV